MDEGLDTERRSSRGSARAEAKESKERNNTTETHGSVLRRESSAEIAKLKDLPTSRKRLSAQEYEADDRREVRNRSLTHVAVSRVREPLAESRRDRSDERRRSGPAQQAGHRAEDEIVNRGRGKTILFGDNPRISIRQEPRSLSEDQEMEEDDVELIPQMKPNQPP